MVAHFKKWGSIGWSSSVQSPALPDNEGRKERTDGQTEGREEGRKTCVIGDRKSPQFL
jgi:hypothetical protein